MKRSMFVLMLVACGGSDKPPPPPDTGTPITAVDCPTYCGQMKANCAGANAQYSPDTNCAAVCSSFAVGASTDKDASGNTLGCRIHSAIEGGSAANCASAGPAGDLMPLKDPVKPGGCSGGDLCAGFCALEIQACGSLDAPLQGNPKDDTGSPIFQYRNMADCVKQCISYDKTHIYSPASTGDSLACRIAQAVTAANTPPDSRGAACLASGEIATGVCAGGATP